MKSLNLIKFTAIFLVALLPCAIFSLSLLNYNRFLSICAVAALPEGVWGYIGGYSENALDFDYYYESGQPQGTSDDSPITQSAKDSVTVAVKEAVMGNIIKKTLSPYSSQLKYNNIYLSNSTSAEIDVGSELSKPLSFTVTNDSQPQVLIYHTHTTEGYMGSEEEYYTTADEPRTTDETKNIVAVGNVVKQRLESAGFSVIHDTTIHDYPGFSGSYSRSAETVKANLEKYPSIKVVIDIHRDSITSGNDKVAPVVEVNGKEAAQVMLVMGSETGTITNHPNWRDNLRLALKLQYLFESTYPKFARTMLLRSTRYNQNLSKGAFLIEIGSEANTLEQALYSAELVGDTLTMLLKS